MNYTTSKKKNDFQKIWILNDKDLENYDKVTF